ncbi:GMC family oxidoreductase [Cupriavidus gilardii]|uniref:GMC family oxidoreductase n=1 Tax=Cupriavidus gilardii TaxID=82541 RepID=A0A6N1BFN0_9BURK|nr:GMC family oxidoreductase [Cupriavidus gilardii]ALD92287.1 Choline dehydrogenase-related flavoproteins [Cupriavidus gilardii CR3]QQE09171.1 GMC family oxidoreductase [Cupriavidus sp. ISTL7]KAB0595736.1 GMC family oxidoreductase [Cupriavidus gilardii]MCT9014774.1 GMC family oxidoreductase [Cupriavidus gilardii]MCT9053186.1 GMC family oxidoreductase [Cupriavidus gilardii]
MATRIDLNDRDAVVIIGSGAGGATLANELAQRGIGKIVILEAGKHYTQADFENDEWAMFRKISWLDKRISAGGWHHTKTYPNLPAWIVKAVGGSTIHWSGVALRFQPHDFRTRQIYGQVEGANVLDWPITYEELAPYYDKAEKKMGVTGSAASGQPPMPESNQYKVVAAGARKIGYRKIVRPVASNSTPYDGRPACQQAGFCMQGCKIGAKWSALYTEIPKALATGRVELRPESMVLQVQHDKSGKVNGVLYADSKGRKHLQKARVVCVAGNSIESARLLLNSASSLFPNGLANSSGQVGRNYMNHATAAAVAIHRKPVYMYRGFDIGAVVADEVALDTKRGFNGGYYLEGLALGLPYTAAFMKPGGWGRDVTSALEQYDHMTAIWVCGEDMAREQNTITLHPTEKDQYGLPIPIVTKTYHRNDEAIAAHGLQQFRKLSEAVGATRVIDMPAYPASHNMGTNRMSANARDGVVNRWGQAHDVKNLFVSDGSQFTSSSAANPTLTIVALAIRQAEYLAGALRKGEV